LRVSKKETEFIKLLKSVRQKSSYKRRNYHHISDYLVDMLVLIRNTFNFKYDDLNITMNVQNIFNTHNSPIEINPNFINSDTFTELQGSIKF